MIGCLLPYKNYRNLRKPVETYEDYLAGNDGIVEAPPAATPSVTPTATQTPSPTITPNASKTPTPTITRTPSPTPPSSIQQITIQGPVFGFEYELPQKYRPSRLGFSDFSIQNNSNLLMIEEFVGRVPDAFTSSGLGERLFILERITGRNAIRIATIVDYDTEDERVTSLLENSSITLTLQYT